MIEDTRERVHRYIHSAWKRETSEILKSERRNEILHEHQVLIEALESSDAHKIQEAVHAAHKRNPSTHPNQLHGIIRTKGR